MHSLLRQDKHKTTHRLPDWGFIRSGQVTNPLTQYKNNTPNKEKVQTTHLWKNMQVQTWCCISKVTEHDNRLPRNQLVSQGPAPTFSNGVKSGPSVYSNSMAKSSPSWYKPENLSFLPLPSIRSSILCWVGTIVTWLILSPLIYSNH